MEGPAIAAVGLAVAVALGAFTAWRLAERRSTGAQAHADRLRERLRHSEAERRLRDDVLGSMEEGVILFAEDGSLAFSNPAAEWHLGNLPSGLSTLAPIALQETVRRTLEREGTASTEVEVGSPARWLRGSAVRVGDEGSVLLVLRDVTESKRADAIRRDFVANASHELKTPAASIQAAAETIRRAVDDDPGVVPRFSGQLEREAARLSRIVSDLLDLSRLESGSELADRVALDGVVREEAARFREAAERSTIDLALDVRPTSPVRGSARDLALLVRNLIDNAIRYTSEGGRVEVTLAPEDGEVLLRVADDGAGIPSRDLSRIFERFYRVDRARSRETGGTGLGLSIVKHVTENHHGSITVQSELGRGSTFEVRLPVEPPSTA